MEVDVYKRQDMYNADGSQGIMCGNGVRCVGKYAYDHGLSLIHISGQVFFPPMHTKLFM